MFLLLLGHLVRSVTRRVETRLIEANRLDVKENHEPKLRFSVSLFLCWRNLERPDRAVSASEADCHYVSSYATFRRFAA